MANEVRFSIPDRPLGRADVGFQVWCDGSMLGTLKVSKGTLVWFPSSTSYGYRIAWGNFDQLMQQHATSFEKR